MAEKQGGGFLKEEIAGIPGWIWLVGAGVVVLGYLYLRHQSSSTQGSADQQSAGQKQPAASVTLIPFMDKTTITDMHKHPAKGKTKNTTTSNANAPGNPSGPIVGD